jgi:hypothetical protein
MSNSSEISFALEKRRFPADQTDEVSIRVVTVIRGKKHDLESVISWAKRRHACRASSIKQAKIKNRMTYCSGSIVRLYSAASLSGPHGHQFYGQLLTARLN